MSGLEFWLIGAATCGVMALAVVATLGILRALPWQQGLSPQHGAALLPHWRNNDALRSDWDRRLSEAEAQRATEPVLSVTFLRNGQYTVLYEGRDVTRDVKASDWRFRGQPGDTLHVIVFLARDDTLIGFPPEPGKDGIPADWLRDIAPGGVRIVESEKD